MSASVTDSEIASRRRLRGPDSERVRRAQVTDPVVGQDFVCGSEHFTAWKHESLSPAEIEFNRQEFVFRIAQNFHQVSKVLDRTAVDGLNNL